IRRIVPVIRALTAVSKLPVSVDAYRSEVVSAALDAGAALVNDIHGFRADPAVAAVAAHAGVPAVVMHNQRGRAFHDVVTDISDGITESFRIATAAGLSPGMLIADPGFGFGWTVPQNLEMLRRLRELHSLGLPLLIGTSRKSTIGAVLELEAPDRLW